ncbi:hypothetical protein Dvina_11220 [Dactylosporangium vinaceum]|uniref:Uncharacterized protein n=1 Tax=Dactylosporangium vinaceum TaxID=53362 RepID=A0ABV5MMZ6_9ACTN|nr:hypothetical protein [Dactylosporangium vinaceum]UAB98600.1 hypothetical protein Dvina_11220 [Dactylosporangium vinaceum]
MSTFPFAMIVSQSSLAEQYGSAWNGETFEYASALPSAPVVTHAVAVRPPRAYRTRNALAATLRRVAEAVAPAPAVHSRPAR